MFHDGKELKKWFLFSLLSSLSQHGNIDKSSREKKNKCMSVMRFEEIVNCKGSLIGTHSSITLHSNTEKTLEFEELFEN